MRDQLDDDRQILVGGRYRLDGRIGQGSMGTVYRARDNETGTAVAIKHLRPETTLRDPRSVSRFLREGEALRGWITRTSSSCSPPSRMARTTTW